MFNYLEYRSLNWLKKIEYVSHVLNLKSNELTYIIEIENDYNESLSYCYNESLSIDSKEKVYLINILFNYLVTVGEYDDNKIEEIWNSKSIYVDLIKKPPWFQDSLRIYLMNNRAQGLKKCVDWIRS